MAEARVCRICLAIDVRLHDLQLYPLDNYLEPFVGTNPLSSIDLPLYICFECVALLKKYYLFREKCLLSQSILYSILHTNGQITPQAIRQIDRQDLQLASPLQTITIAEESVKNIIFVDHEDVKDEPEDDTENFDSKDDFVKQEGSCDDFALADITDYAGEVSSDDDEPLSFHKSNKDKVLSNKKKKKVKTNRRKSERSEHDQDGDEQPPELSPKSLESIKEDTSTSPVNPSPSPPVKRKRGRPRKAAEPPKKKRSRRTVNTGGVVAEDIDLEEYVTIVKLTEAEQIEEITKRQHSANYLNAAFQCDLCYKGFIDTHAWTHHVGKHDPSAGDIVCGVCKFRFKSRRSLQKHAANHEKKYACKACSYVSKTTTQARQHQRWHKGVTYKCQYCDEVSGKWTSYLSHVRIKHPSEFICGVCGYSFVSKLGLTMHKTMMHKDVAEKAESSNSVEAGPYCGECDVKFISLEAYKRHMVTSAKHMQVKDFSTGCRVCGSSFASAEELRLHHRKEHARKRPKNYGKKPSHISWPAQCEHCPETIPNAREYWTHFRRVHPDEKYPIQKNHVCDICGKSFRGNAFLVYHKRTHFEERAYKCAQCPKAFFNRTNLQMHEKTHSDIRPYPCNVCFKAFKCKGALDRHYRSHTGVKPYECEVCGKAFGQSNSRKLHVRTVHLKQPAPYVSRSRLERRRPPPPACAVSAFTRTYLEDTG